MEEGSVEEENGCPQLEAAVAAAVETLGFWPYGSVVLLLSGEASSGTRGSSLLGPCLRVDAPALLAMDACPPGEKREGRDQSVEGEEAELFSFWTQEVCRRIPSTLSPRLSFEELNASLNPREVNRADARENFCVWGSAQVLFFEGRTGRWAAERISLLAELLLRELGQKKVHVTGCWTLGEALALQSPSHGHPLEGEKAGREKAEVGYLKIPIPCPFPPEEFTHHQGGKLSLSPIQRSEGVESRVLEEIDERTIPLALADQQILFARFLESMQKTEFSKQGERKIQKFLFAADQLLLLFGPGVPAQGVTAQSVPAQRESIVRRESIALSLKEEEGTCSSSSLSGLGGLSDHEGLAGYQETVKSHVPIFLSDLLAPWGVGALLSVVCGRNGILRPQERKDHAERALQGECPSLSVEKIESLRTLMLNLMEILRSFEGSILASKHLGVADEMDCLRRGETRREALYDCCLYLCAWTYWAVGEASAARALLELFARQKEEKIPFHTQALVREFMMHVLSEGKMSPLALGTSTEGSSFSRQGRTVRGEEAVNSMRSLRA